MTILHTYHQPDQFVNRQAEIGEFEQLIAENSHRVLLIHGPEGMGKSGLLHYLIRQRSDRSMVQAFVDFRLKSEVCTLPETLIYHLGEQLGDLFFDLLDAIDAEEPVAQVQLNPQILSQIDAGALNQGLAQMKEDVSQAVVRHMATAQSSVQNADTIVNTSGGAYFEGDIETSGGDVIGRDRIDIDIANNFFLSPAATLPDPAAGQQRSAARAARRRNRLFRKSLIDLLAAERVILYFDHCEEAEDAVCEWLIKELLEGYLDPLLDTSGLRIILAGRSVPWQEDADNLDSIVSAQELSNLELEHVEEYLVEKRGLKSGEVGEVMQASAGVPFLLLQEAEKRLRQSGNE